MALLSSALDRGENTRVILRGIAEHPVGDTACEGGGGAFCGAFGGPAKARLDRELCPPNGTDDAMPVSIFE